MIGLVAPVLGFALCIACQGQGQEPRGSSTGSGMASAATPPVSIDAALATGEPELHETRTQPDELEVVDPGRVIADLGAIPAWQAVVDRAQLLGRRNQHGVVYGRVGAALLVPAAIPVAFPGTAAGSAGAFVPADAASATPPALADAATAPPADAATRPATSAPTATAIAATTARPATALSADAATATRPAAATPADAAIDGGLVKSPYVWLIDDTEGNGSLGIRIALGDRAKEGDRIAAGGAWQLDADRRWFWKPDSIQALPPGPPSDLKEPEPPEPSHAITGSSLPAGAHAISVAHDNDAVYFQIVGPAPLVDGEGWQVADQLGSPPVAVMTLPGERASYGGLDMRTPDERWQLKRGQTYWVRIGKLHKRADKPTTVNARTAPVRVL